VVAAMRADEVLVQLRLQHLCARLHALGPRATLGFVEQIIESMPPLYRREIHAVLEEFAALDPDILRKLGLDQIPSAPMHIVSRSRP
jgi:hypothetical protein